MTTTSEAAGGREPREDPAMKIEGPVQHRSSALLIRSISTAHQYCIYGCMTRAAAFEPHAARRRGLARRTSTGRYASGRHTSGRHASGRHTSSGQTRENESVRRMQVPETHTGRQRHTGESSTPPTSIPGGRLANRTEGRSPGFPGVRGVRRRTYRTGRECRAPALSPAVPSRHASEPPWGGEVVAVTRGFAKCRRTARITVAGTAPE